MKKKTMILGTLAFLFFGLFSCKSADRFPFVGSEYMDSAVFETFSDPGVVLPEGYSYVVSGEIDPNHLGTYELSYSIFDDKGVMVEEKTRYVTVVDLTPPELEAPRQIITLYFGLEEENLQETIVIHDNYYEDEKLTISCNLQEIAGGYNPGTYTITIFGEDPSGNMAQIEKTVEAKFDFLPVLENENYDENPEVSRSWSHPWSNERFTLQFDDGDEFLLFYTKNFRSSHYFLEESGFTKSITITFSGVYGFLNDSTVFISISYMGDTTSGRLNHVDLTEEFDGSAYAQLEDFVDDSGLGHEYAFSYLKEHLPLALAEFKGIIEDDLGFPFQ